MFAGIKQATKENTMALENQTSELERRKFLAVCGRFAVITPPAMSILLSTSLTSTAIASSGGNGNNGGGKGNNGYGNGGGDGSPNGKDDSNR
jgi:hypothetical protein